MKQIAVLLTVFNRKDCTEKALYNLYKNRTNEEISIDVYLTDDCCTDGTPEMVRQKYPSVIIIQGDGHLFWNRGMYKAWQEASKRFDYDYYLWLNDDTYLNENAISTILNDSNSMQDKAIISGATKSALNGECTYGLHDKNTEKLLVPNGELQKGTNLNGNIVLVPKYVFHILGNLDPYYCHAGGDTDYGLRAKEKGIDVLLSTHYIGCCEQHSSLSVWCNPEYPFWQRWNALNKPTGMPLRMLFYHERKHYGILIALFHSCTTILHCMFPKLWNSFNL